MDKKEQILVKNIIDKLKKDKTSNFLDARELKLVINELNKQKIKYNIYYPYPESDRVILYNKTLPSIKLLKIITKNTIKHADILGSLYNTQIDMSLIGDIIINGNYYIIVIDTIYDYLKYNLFNIGKYKIQLMETNIDQLEHYKRQYEIIQLPVSSLRMDVIVSKLTHISRNKINEVFLKKEVILNYEILNSFNCLKENDVFSIRKYGKYKYIGIKGISKSGNKIIILNKYL